MFNTFKSHPFHFPLPTSTCISLLTITLVKIFTSSLNQGSGLSLTIVFISLMLSLSTVLLYVLSNYTLSDIMELIFRGLVLFALIWLLSKLVIIIFPGLIPSKYLICYIANNSLILDDATLLDWRRDIYKDFIARKFLNVVARKHHLPDELLRIIQVKHYRLMEVEVDDTGFSLPIIPPNPYDILVSCKKLNLNYPA